MMTPKPRHQGQIFGKLVQNGCTFVPRGPNLTSPSNLKQTSSDCGESEKNGRGSGWFRGLALPPDTALVSTSCTSFPWAASTNQASYPSILKAGQASTPTFYTEIEIANPYPTTRSTQFRICDIIPTRTHNIKTKSSPPNSILTPYSET